MCVAVLFGVVAPGSEPPWIQRVDLHEKLSERETDIKRRTTKHHSFTITTVATSKRKQMQNTPALITWPRTSCAIKEFNEKRQQVWVNTRLIKTGIKFIKCKCASLKRKSRSAHYIICIRSSWRMKKSFQSPASFTLLSTRRTLQWTRGARLWTHLRALLS